MTGPVGTLIPRWCAPGFLLACVLLGGASAAGVIANAVLQLLALAVVGTILARGALPPLPPAARAILRLLALAAALMLAQLVPLPHPIWRPLPGHAEVARAFALAAAGTPWLPVSLTPDATLAAMLSLLPPLAMIVAVLAASNRGRIASAHVLIAIALASALLGSAQALGGAESPLYPYAITNRGSAVGLFANRNHLGTLLLCALPFVAALADAPRRAADTGRRVGAYLLLATTAAVLACAIVLTGSTAAAALLLPTILASVLFVSPARPRRVPRGWALAAAALLLLLGGGAMLATIRSGHVVASDANPQHRATITPTTLRAAARYLPFGAGGGSFRSVYPAFEDPARASLEYVNHAHDDYAEVLLEYGLPGFALVAAALVAWAARARALRHAEGQGGALARAGIVALGVIFAHSLVDYPLRTAAIATVAGMAAAFAAAPAALVAHRSTKQTPEETSISVPIESI